MTSDTGAYENAYEKAPDAVALGHSAAPGNAPYGELTASNKVCRTITFCLQMIAVLVYYIPTLLTRGSVSIVWLLPAVAQTILFCAIFFRDSRTRVALSVVLMVFAIMANLAMFAFLGFYELLLSRFGLSLATGFIYVLCSTFAVIFALCFPRKYRCQAASSNPMPSQIQED